MPRSLVSSSARVFGLAAAAALVAAGSVFGLAAPASAHNYLVESTPATGQTLTELPANFEITTNEALLDLGGDGSGFALQVRGADGLYYGDGCITVTNATMSTPAAIGPAGKYTVLWQVVSADGHTVSDEFPFTWAPGGDVTASKGSATAATCGGTSGGSAPSAPAASADQSSGTHVKPTDTANLGDVLTIGGAVVAVGLAIAITLFVVGRRKPARAADTGTTDTAQGLPEE